MPRKKDVICLNLNNVTRKAYRDWWWNLSPLSDMRTAPNTIDMGVEMSPVTNNFGKIFERLAYLIHNISCENGLMRDTFRELHELRFKLETLTEKESERIRKEKGVSEK